MKTNTRKTYQAPELREVGAVAEMTKEQGWGLEELFASIVSGGPVSGPPGGTCDGSCFS